MTFRSFFTLCVATVFSLAPTIAAAEFVVDLRGDLTGGLGHFRSDLQAGNQIGDDFSITSPAMIGSIEWSGIYYGSAERYSPDDFADQFRVDFHRLAGNVPAAAPLHSYTIAPGRLTRTDSGIDALGADVYEYSASLSPLRLDPGQYVLSIVNNTPADELNRWYWTTSATGGDGFFRTYEGSGDWSTEWMAPQSASFALRGVTSVPEPASLATLAFCLTIGCGGAGRLWKRRRVTSRAAAT